MDVTKGAGDRIGWGPGKASLLALLCVMVFAAPARAAGMITITGVEPPAGGASGSPPLTGPRPTIVGTTTEAGQPVHVEVLEGSTVVRTGLEAIPNSEGAWSVSVPAAEPLPEGSSYSAVASQEAGASVSPSFLFAVTTSPPTVSLNQPPGRVGNTIPAFSGKGSEAGTEVTVHVRNAAEEEVARGHGTVTGGKWSAALESTPPEGSYTVEATEESALGNGQGHSSAWPIEVITRAPSVALAKPPARTGELSPTFSGTGEAGGELVVSVENTETHVEIGKGKVVVGSGGKWSTGLEKPLPNGDYKAAVSAVEKSALAGNPAGEAGPDAFEVVTSTPNVTLATPESPSDRRSPAFSGTGEEGGEVVVHVVRSGTEIGTGKVLVGAGGSWSTGLEAQLPKGTYSYTVYATEASTVPGNGSGESSHDSVAFNTEAPPLSLKAPAPRSSDLSPAFSGTGEAGAHVVVHVLRAGTSEEIDSGEVIVASGGAWSAGLTKELPGGEYAYTVYATEASTLSENPASESARYEVEVDTLAPKLTLHEPPRRSSETSPTFSGTGEAGGEVLVHVTVVGTGEEITGKGVVASGGDWSASLGKSLPAGEHTYKVYATEASTLPNDPAGESAHFTVELDTQGPTVTLTAPAKRSNDLTPTFSGTSTEAGEVLLHVTKLGGGGEIDSGKAAVGTEGSWSGGLEKPLPGGAYEYSVYATQTSALAGDPKGESKHWTVQLDTEAPAVVLAKPPARTRELTPTFTGTGSEEGGEVVVDVLENGLPIDVGQTTVGEGGSWSATLQSPLPSGDHSYTVEAVEYSQLSGNPAGHSKPWPMEVDTNPPTITLVEPAKRSSKLSPTFSGTGSEEGTEVSVRVFNEAHTEIGHGKTKVGTGGKWSAGLEAALPEGSYAATVIAEEKSGLGNGSGRTEAGFVIDTQAPTVTLTAPAKRSNNLNPVFSGTGSEEGTEVIVHVFDEHHTEIGHGKTTVGAGQAWSAGLEGALPKGRYVATVVAEEKSGLAGDPAGETPPDAFEVDTLAPAVKLTEPSTRSNVASPTFSGSGEAGGEVVVHVLNAETDAEIDHGAVTVGGGESWSTGLEKPLAKGDYTYTVYATETGTLSGNPAGESKRFDVEFDTEAPNVSLNEPAVRSNKLNPTFSGHGSEEGGEVDVHVLKAGSSEEIDTGTARVGSGGTWSAGLAHALPSGSYGYTVYATEASTLPPDPPGESAHYNVAFDNEAPKVTLAAPAKRSNNLSPTFSGTGSEEGTEVRVHVYRAGTSEEIAKGKTTVGPGGAWSTGLEKSLPGGSYKATVVAVETSGLSGNPAGESATEEFEIDTLVPTLTFETPAKRTSNLAPTFSGTGEAGAEVVVTVTKGSETYLGKTKVTSEGKWSTDLERELPKGQYGVTASVKEASALSGNPGAEAGPDGFEVDTQAPTVKLEAPSPKRSNNLKPVFSGTGSEEGTEVLVRVFKVATGQEIGIGKATVGSGGKWSAKLEAELPTGNYAATVVAEEKSGLGGNPAGKAEAPLEVDTEAPTVTLEAPSPKRSNNLKPVFSGTGSEEGTEVVVRVFKVATGQEIGKGRTKVSGGTWSSKLEAELPTGNYAATVVAEEKSGLGGNPAGKAEAPLEVDTEAPKVTLEAPAKRSSNLTPTFSGSGSEEGTEVLVRVFKAGTSEELGKGKTTVGSGGKWSAGIEKALLKGEYPVTVVVEEKSGLSGNPAGKTETGYEIDTEAPKVTLEAPAKRSNNLTPTYSGSGSEEGTVVTVQVFNARHEDVGHATTKVGSGGKWSTGLEKALPKGEYEATVVVTEASGLGNAAGEASAEFELNTEPPHLVLASPPEVSGNTTPTFTGTSSETAPQVAVRVYAGTSATGNPVTTLVTHVEAGGGYKVTAGSELAEGKYTATATQASELEGNPEAVTAPVTFAIVKAAPSVEITSKPAAESNTLTPSFAGTVKAPKSEEEPVELEIHEGTSTLAPLIRVIPATVSAGRWGPVTVPSGALRGGRHTYTAVASTKSAINTGVGVSAPWTFVVNTDAPTVKLNQPVSPSNELRPTFSGTASEEGEIVVHVMEGSTPLMTATGHTSHGEWSAKAATALPEGEHQFSVYATEASPLGNEKGQSTPWAFTVDTLPPVIDVTQPPSARSSDRRPLISGTASDHTEVTVELHAGSVAGPVASTMTGRVEDGEWFVQQQEPLEFGEYTLVAKQPSSIGNRAGQSTPITFTVAPIAPLSLTEEPTEVAETHVALYGSVNPQGGPIGSCVFEVGTTTAYGRQIECGFVGGTLKAFPPAATGAIAVFVRVYALTPNTTYHARVVATGEGGIGYGPDKTFTTLPEEQRHILLPPATPPPPAKGTGSVLGSLAELLVPSGRAARIGTLLHHGYRQSFKAPQAGSLTINWYYVRRGQKLGGRGKHAPTLVASGRVVAKAAGTVTLLVRLSAAGRRLLAHARKVQLTDACAFTPAGGATVRSTGRFQLRR
jgi:hypothetical protein